MTNAKVLQRKSSRITSALSSADIAKLKVRPRGLSLGQMAAKAIVDSKVGDDNTSRPCMEVQEIRANDRDSLTSRGIIVDASLIPGIVSGWLNPKHNGKLLPVSLHIFPKGALFVEEAVRRRSGHTRVVFWTQGTQTSLPIRRKGTTVRACREIISRLPTSAFVGIGKNNLDKLKDSQDDIVPLCAMQNTTFCKLFGFDYGDMKGDMTSGKSLSAAALSIAMANAVATGGPEGNSASQRSLRSIVVYSSMGFDGWEDPDVDWWKNMEDMTMVQQLVPSAGKAKNSSTTPPVSPSQSTIATTVATVTLPPSTPQTPSVQSDQGHFNLELFEEENLATGGIYLTGTLLPDTSVVAEAQHDSSTSKRQGRSQRQGGRSRRRRKPDTSPKLKTAETHPDEEPDDAVGKTIDIFHKYHFDSRKMGAARDPKFLEKRRRLVARATSMFAEISADLLLLGSEHK